MCAAGAISRAILALALSVTCWFCAGEGTTPDTAADAGSGEPDVTADPQPEEACVELSATYRVQGRVIRPGALEGTIHVRLFESALSRCLESGGRMGAIPGPLVASAELPEGEEFDLEVTLTWVDLEDNPYMREVPDIELVAFIDVEGDDRCDADTDVGGGMALPPEDHEGLEIQLTRGFCRIIEG